ncbi:DNA translocase FtsK [Lactobacillus gasseri]|uniref:DNA translocase FtsK n=1 Tax=Lactobacillus paragasseri TaxID=2107999 RepID=A0AAW6XKY2_9LACO|nr:MULTISPECIES: DNA translocase FtsK [Lactobacillus]MCQ5246972.1 DNA translocase FtsK [Lactobacillus gasseri]MCZ3509127.1 DNA translocase FtsK [Lactobacillus gasseri]MDK6868855.1 DNA translocase FtsK [Lactobacillus paragasseri]TVU99612.1 DNA translocase FtsK [Lactobacillus paragasseri]
MAKKRKRRTKRKRKTTTKKKKQSMEWVITGIVLVLIAVLSCVHFGLFSQQLINLIRFFVGDSHYLASIVLGLVGLVMVIYNQPPRFGLKRGSGLGIFYLGLLLWESSRVFNQMMIHQGFVNAFLTSIGEEFSRAQITTKVGGGFIGSMFYQLIFPILGTVGSEVISLLMMLVGVLMICNVKFATLLSGFQKGSQLVIEKNKDAGDALKNKYNDLVEKHEQSKQEKLNNREKLTDPLDNHDDTFPSTADFTEDAPISNKTQDLEETPHFVPPIEVSQENTAASETEVGDNLTDDLPISHSYAEEDQKMKQELQDVDHGDLETKQHAQTKNANYQKPPINLLAPIKSVDQSQDKSLIQKNTEVLESTFKSFGVHVIVKKAVLGPTVTRYEVQPAVGVKVSKIVNLADDLALALAAKDIRIEAPIPGKPLIGIEVPNRTTSAVSFKDVMLHQDSKAKDISLDVPLGKDVEGKVISADLRKMPHLLIAGSTGSGKSVAINTIITSILMKSYPEDVKLVLIDPKMVELSVYNGIPHLLIPVVTDAKLATNALRKTVKEMERRYQLFAAGGVRNITEYNQKVAENNADKTNTVMEKLPYIVVIVDELSDLMMVAGHDVEDAIVRLAQMARAAGIHMILATQRPSVDVITGLIKANVPSRISFAVSSGVDSRTILDQVGAEKLLGRGDMLFLPIGAAKPERVQGAFISVNEVEKIVSWVKEQQEAVYNEDMIPSKNDSENQTDGEDEPEDEFYDQAVALVRKQQSASVSMLQRRFRIGYNRAARIADAMEAKGIVGPSEGSKPRQVLIPPEKDDDQ